MQLDFEELDYQQTPLGDISLRRREKSWGYPGSWRISK
jgi:hypothetical protein